MNRHFPWVTGNIGLLSVKCTLPKAAREYASQVQKYGTLKCRFAVAVLTRQPLSCAYGA